MQLPRHLVGLAAALAIAAATTPTARAEQDPMARGEELYQLCTQCHGEAGEGMQLSLAPNIAGMP